MKRRRLVVLTLLLALIGAARSQETPPAEDKRPDAAKQTSPKFSASLLLIKSDWSKSPHAKEIEAELREALKDAPVPKALLDKLPASAPQILFAPENVSFYSGEHFAEFLAWLKEHELLVREDAFKQAEPPPRSESGTSFARSVFSGYDKNQNGKLDKEEWQQITYYRPADADNDDILTFEEFVAFSLAEGEKRARNTRVMKQDESFIPLPRPKTESDQPLVRRRPELTWLVSWQEGGYSFSRQRTVSQQTRGEAKPEHAIMVDSSLLGFNLPDDEVAIVNAFPARTEEPYRSAAREQGFEAVVVVRHGVDVRSAKTSARLHLPDRIDVPHVEHEVMDQRSPYMSTPAPTPAFQEAPLTKIFHLQNASASKLRDVVLQIAPGEIRLAIDERTNALIVSGSEGTLAELEAIVMRLDEPGLAAENKNPAPQPAGTVAELKQQYAAAEQEAARLAKESKPHKDKLHAAVAKSFELRQKLLQAELAEFRQRSERIEQSLRQREGIKQQIIQRRVDDLLKPGLEWEGTEAKPAARPAKSAATTKLSPEQTARQAGALRLQELELQQAEAVLRVAEAELANAVKLNEKGYISQTELVRLQSQATIASLGVEKARIMMDLFQHVVPNEKPRDSLEVDRETHIKLQELDLQQATLELKAAEAEYKHLEELARKGTIRDSELTEAKLAVTRAQAKLDKAKLLLDAELQIASPGGKRRSDPRIDPD